MLNNNTENLVRVDLIGVLPKEDLIETMHAYSEYVVEFMDNKQYECGATIVDIEDFIKNKDHYINFFNY